MNQPATPPAKQTPNMLHQWIRNGIIQTSQEEKAARFKARGQGSRQRAKKRAIANQAA